MQKHQQSTPEIQYIYILHELRQNHTQKRRNYKQRESQAPMFNAFARLGLENRMSRDEKHFELFFLFKIKVATEVDLRAVSERRNVTKEFTEKL